MGKILKILFIKPDAQTPYPIIDIPLGILCLSAYLKKHMGEQVRIEMIDLRLEKQKRNALRKRLSTFLPDMIGVSMLTFERNFLKEYGKEIEEHAPHAEIVLGGPHATIHYAELLRAHKVSAVVIGEGEATLLELVRCRLAGEDASHIRGTARRDGDRLAVNDGREYIKNLDELPWPDYALIDIRRYWGRHYQMNVILAAKTYAPVMSSRACPYGCIYCHNLFGKGFRPRSPAHFVGEVRMLHDVYGVREFHIVDDIFNFDRSRMHAILGLIIESGMRIRLAFPNGLRGDLLSREDLLMLKKAGAYMLTFALETGSERIQAMIHKHLNIEKVMRNIEFASGIGLITKGYFMLGFPGETVAEMRQTVNLAVASKLDMLNFFVVVPFFGTPLYDEALRIAPNLKPDAYDSYLTERSFYQDCTGYDVRRLIREAHRRFFRLKRLFWSFGKAPRKTYFLFIYARMIFDLAKIEYRKRRDRLFHERAALRRTGAIASRKYKER